MKNNIIAIILVLTIFLPIVTSENIKSTEPIKNTNYTTIDSNIILSKKHMPILKQSISQIKNTQIKEFIKQVINTINKKKLASKNDLKTIINNLNLNDEIKGIHFLCIINSDGIGYGYPRGIYPFIFDFLFYNLIQSETFLGPSIFVEWKSPNANTKINGKKIYDEPHNGYIFGFFGYTYSGGMWPVIYRILGVCNLVIITDYDYN